MATEILIKEIIKEQSYIIGTSLAESMATSTGAIKINEGTVELIKTEEQALKDVILAYEKLFGEVSVKVCIKVIEKHGEPELKQVTDSVKQFLTK